MSYKNLVWYKFAALLMVLALIIPILVACSSSNNNNTKTSVQTTPVKTTPVLASNVSVGGRGFDGPLVRNVQQISFDPSTHKLSYAKTDDGLFKSSDDGAIWSWVTSSSSIILNPSNPSDIWDERTNGVFRSDDGGLTWAQDRSGLSRIVRIVPIPGIAGALYAETENGILRSQDNGATWTLSNTGLPPGHMTLSIDPSDPKHLFATSMEELYQSQDGGLSWTLIRNFTEGIGAAIAIDPSNNSNLYVGSVGWKGYTSLMRSTDAGKTWVRINESGVFDSNSIDYVVIDPQHPQILYVGVNGWLYKSSDSGKSFTWMQKSGNFNFVVIDPANASKLVAGTHNGVYQSSDGGVTWQNKSVGFIHGQGEATNFIVSDGSGNFFAGTEKGLFLSTDKLHQIWNPLYSDASVYSLLLPSGSATSSYIGTGHGLLVSTDSRQTWKSVPTGLSSDASVYAVTRDPYDSNHLLVGTRGLIVSTDGGISWHPGGGAFALEVRSIIADSTTKGRFYILDGAGGCYRTDDGGTTWVQINPQVSSSKVTYLSIDEYSKTVYAWTGVLWVSQDAGNSWQSREDPNTYNKTQYGSRLVFGSGKGPTVIYLLTIDGLFQWQNDAKSWVRISPQPPRGIDGVFYSVSGAALYLDQKAGELVVVTCEGAVYVVR